jgi:hypothetical protein
MESLCNDLQHLVSTYLSGADLVNLIENHDLLKSRYLADWNFWHQRSLTDFSQPEIKGLSSINKDTFQRYGSTPSLAYLNCNKLREIYSYHQEATRLRAEEQALSNRVRRLEFAIRYSSIPFMLLMGKVSKRSSLEKQIKDIEYQRQRVHEAITQLLREIISGKIGQVVNEEILRYLFVELKYQNHDIEFNDLWSELFPQLAFSLETGLAIRLFYFIIHPAIRDEFIDLLGSLGDFDDLIQGQELGSVYLMNLVRRFQHDANNLKQISDYYDHLNEDTRRSLSGDLSLTIDSPMAKDLIASLK